MSYEILEIGPAILPLHQVEFKLEEDQKYTAVDQSREMIDHAIWKALKEKYPDRINLIHGTKEEMEFEDGSFNEIVMMGTADQSAKSEEVDKLDRLLKPGGFFRLGTTFFGKQNPILAAWEAKLSAKGYELIRDETKEYDYVYLRDEFSKRVKKVYELSIPSSSATEIPYVVYTFRKAILSQPGS